MPRPGRRRQGGLSRRDRPADVRGGHQHARRGSRRTTTPALGLDFSMVVHGEQSFSYARPLHAGDVVVATTTIESVKSVGAMSMLVTSTDIATVEGEHVCTAKSDARRAGGGRMTATLRQRREGHRAARAHLPGHPARPGQVRRRLRRLQRHPLERPRRPRGRPAERDRARHVHDGAGGQVRHRVGRRRPGRGHRLRRAFSAMVPVPDDDEGATIEISGKVLDKLDGNKVTVDIVAAGRRREGAHPRPRHRPPPVTSSCDQALRRLHHAGARRPGAGRSSRPTPSDEPDRRRAVRRRGRRAGAAPRRRLQPGHRRRGLPRHRHPREHPRPRAHAGAGDGRAST